MKPVRSGAVRLWAGISKNLSKGFQAMISPIIILTLAVSLKTTLNALGAADYVHDLM